MKFDIEQSVKEKPFKDWQLELFWKLAENEPAPLDSIEHLLCIFSTPRSGSTLFCEALNSTGLVGHIDEWFNYEYFRAWYHVLKKDDFNLEEYVRWIIQHTVRDTGVFGVHWHIAQVYAMMKDWKFGLGNMKITHGVLIRRADKIAQAVSMAKAFKSDQFRSYEQPKPIDGLSNYEVARALSVITEHEDRIPEFYNRGVIHATHYYEDFSKADDAYRATLLAVGKQTSPILIFDPKTKKQRNEWSIQRAQDFRKYILGIYNA